MLITSFVTLNTDSLRSPLGGSRILNDGGHQFQRILKSHSFPFFQMPND